MSVTTATAGMARSLSGRRVARPEMAMTTLVTGATGLLGSHVTRLLVERGDDVRAPCAPARRSTRSTASTSSASTATSSTARAVRRALRGVDRVFHVAGLTSLRAVARQLVTVNVEGTRIVLEEALRAGVERVVHTSSVAAVGPARRGSTADEKPGLRRRRATACPTSTPSTRPRSRRCASPPTGCRVVIVNPAHVFGTRRRATLVDRARAALPAPRDPRLRRRRAQHRRRRRRRARPPARRRARPVGERYILGNRNFTLDRLFADLGRLSGVEPPAIKLPLPAALAFARAARGRCPGTPVITAGRGARRRRCGGRSARPRPSASWAGRPSHHEDTLQATIDWYREREPSALRAPGHAPAARAARRRARRAQAAGLVGRLLG